MITGLGCAAGLREASLPTSAQGPALGPVISGRVWGGSARGQPLEALLDAERAPGDVLHLPRDVLGQADLVVGQHLQHQPQVQPPLLLGQPVPTRGDTALSGSWGRWPSPPASGRSPRTGDADLLEIRHFLELRHGAEGHHLLPQSDHAGGVGRVSKHTPWGGRGRPRSPRSGDSGRAAQCHRCPPDPWLTLAVDLLQLLRHPQHSLHPQLGPIVAVKGGRGPALGAKKR